MSTIEAVTVSGKQKVIDLLVLSFGADPFERWLYPDLYAYLNNFPVFLDALTIQSFETNNVYSVNNGTGAALWLPPNTNLDDRLIVTSLEQTIDKQKQVSTISIMEQMDGYHPHEPHWYLAIIGVDPVCQGQGLGSILLQHTLALCDHDGVLAYLESTNPKNISLYQRHGFELLGRIQAGDAPPLFPMLRHPR